MIKAIINQRSAKVSQDFYDLMRSQNKIGVKKCFSSKYVQLILCFCIISQIKTESFHFFKNILTFQFVKLKDGNVDLMILIKTHHLNSWDVTSECFGRRKISEKYLCQVSDTIVNSGNVSLYFHIYFLHEVHSFSNRCYFPSTLYVLRYNHFLPMLMSN